MRVLITGATGFIGLPLTLRLVEQGHKILALSRKSFKLERSISWLNSDLSSHLTYQEEMRLLNVLSPTEQPRAT